MRLTTIKNIIFDASKSWWNSDPWRQGAITSYYAVFSLPGLLIIIIWLAGAVFGEEAVHGEVSRQVQQFLGSEGAQNIEGIIADARISKDDLWMKLLGVGALIFGATTLFLQLQKTLNQIWGVESAPKNGLIKLVTDRATSFGIIIVIAFLLLISLFVSAIISVVATWVELNLGETWLVSIRATNILVSFSVTTLLFAVMFRALPDVDIGWRSVWIGALTAAALFIAGKFLLSIYFGVAQPASSFGAASSIILVMLWVNYTSLILFFGANVARAYSVHKGHLIKPSPHAKWLDDRQSEMD